MGCGSCGCGLRRGVGFLQTVLHADERVDDGGPSVACATRPIFHNAAYCDACSQHGQQNHKAQTSVLCMRPLGPHSVGGSPGGVGQPVRIGDANTQFYGASAGKRGGTRNPNLTPKAGFASSHTRLGLQSSLWRRLSKIAPLHHRTGARSGGLVPSAFLIVPPARLVPFLPSQGSSKKSLRAAAGGGGVL